MTEETVERKSVTNIQSEMMFIGALYKQPDLYVSYGGYMRSQYDFSDEACKFFYDMFEIMYKTFTQTIEEDKVNMFMSQSDERLRTYKIIEAEISRLRMVAISLSKFGICPMLANSSRIHRT